MYKEIALLCKQRSEHYAITGRGVMSLVSLSVILQVCPEATSFGPEAGQNKSTIPFKVSGRCYFRMHWIWWAPNGTILGTIDKISITYFHEHTHRSIRGQ